MGAEEMGIRELRDGDLEALAATMRPEDAAEVLASGGHSPLEALQEAVRVSPEVWTWAPGGEVAAVFGVVPLPDTPLLAPRSAVVWALTGDAVTRNRKAFVRASRAIVAALLFRWDALLNAVDARYTGALRWLESMGATFAPPVPLGVAGLPFVPFVLEAPRPHV